MEDIFERIEKWNKERLLDKQPFVLETEIINILEELVETKENIESVEARNIAIQLLHLLNNYTFNKREKEEEELIDVFADIIIYATGAIIKAGYNPKKVLEETLKEIESRTGEVIDGKFVKDTSEQAKAKWYKANYRRCKNKNKG